MTTETTTPLITGVAWAGDKLVAIDENVVDDRLRRKALSASTAKSMKGCLARFAVEKLLPRDEDPFTASALGTSTHAVHEDLYTLPADERTLEAFHSIKLAKAEHKWSEEKRLADPTLPSEAAWLESKQRWISEVDRLGLREFEIVDPKKVVVFKTELGFEGVEIAGVPSMGFIDRVEVVQVNGKDALRVVDLKTGKEKTAWDRNRYGDDHGDQIRVYSDALLGTQGAAAAQGAIHYTQFGKSREVPLTPTAMNATRKDFRNSWATHNEIMARGEFVTKPGPLCGWCPAVNSCPAAANAGIKASNRLETQPASAVELGIPQMRPGMKPLGSKLPPVNPVPKEDPAEVISRIATASAEQYAPAVDDAMAPPVPDWIPAHDSGDISDRHQETTMSTDVVFAEGNPREPILNGKLNGASYAAIAVISVPQMAAEILHEAKQPLVPAAIDRMTDLLANIIITVQKQFRGDSAEWADGLNTRIRGALRTTIQITPMPWGTTDENDWVNWEAAAIKRTGFFISRSIRLWNFGQNIPSSSFEAFLPASTPAAETAAATPAKATKPKPVAPKPKPVAAKAA
ncbi:RecB family exonuclease [Agromyces humi]|uniref:RecB family exonuclease n=1 Tax=Agromyces humi TaxID=1766800 RepID=UPI0013576B00|nr:PD-(D/E)XK nuclease family protein [Agromyces humi]